MPKFRRYTKFASLEREDKILARLTLGLPESRSEKGGLQNKKKLNATSLAAKDRLADGPKAASIAAALADLGGRKKPASEWDYGGPSYEKKREAWYAGSASRQRFLADASRHKVQPTAKTRQPYSPTWPLMKSGTAARYSGFTTPQGVPKFKMKSRLMPCIERAARRSVMFALGKAGKGWHAPKRRNENSGVPC